MQKIGYFLPLLMAVSVFAGLRQSQTTLQKPTVLLYNHIVPQTEQGLSFTERYSQVSTEQFRNQLAYLKTHHATFLTKDQYNQALKEHGSPQHLPVVILFRDATPDIASQAFPILQQFGIPAIVFTQADKLDQPTYISHEQARLMQRAGLTITAPNLGLLITPEARQEVSGVIEMPQFIDLLPNQYLISFKAACFLALFSAFMILLALLWPQFGLLILCLFLPTYIIRFKLGGVPFTFLELS